MQAYSDPRRESDPYALPDIEIFHVAGTEARANRKADPEGNCTRAGFYWWSCFPGCLPDSDPIGPFRSEAAALRDARQGLED